MGGRALLLVLTVAAGCGPEKVYVYPDGTPAPPSSQAAAPAPAPTSAGPTAAQMAVQVAGAVAVGILSGFAGPGHLQRMQNWLSANAASIAKCLHGSANSSGEYEILSDDPANNGTTARIKWSGVFESHYTDVLIMVGGDYSHPVATVTVTHDDGNFGTNDSCEYLHGVLMQ